MNPLNSRGTLFGVGVGPGDPELLTLKAVRVLRSVERIYYPLSGSNSGGFARQILAPLELPDEKFREAPIGMSRDRTAAAHDYRRAAEEIAAELMAGGSAAWITEGDPLFYSTFLYVAEEVRRIDPNIQIQVVPGVTSIQAAAAATGFSLVRLAEPLAVVPAAYGLDHLPRLLHDFATIALLKVNSVFDRLLDELAVAGLGVQTVYVEHVGTPQQRIVTELESLRGEKLPYFSLVLVRRPAETTV
ncbi:MAG TPA: precorrin-2 C(20)-methyltransferase [Pirellulales bacterium]|jgi:precorrin-2/cobalt-factor-2 C20-methyltransferase|nr:precorrin-2 C(20)-methyltransferase [Pirellulales bacterium]